MNTGGDRAACPQRMGAIARLARATLSHAVCDVPTGHLTQRELAQLRASAPFSRPLETFLKKHSRMPDASALSAGRLDDMVALPAGRLVALLLSEPPETLEQASILMAAASVQRHALRISVKDERNRLREALGPAGWMVATQEAPALYSPLAANDDDLHLRRAVSPSSGEPSLRAALAEYGIRRLAAMGISFAPGLRDIFDRQFSPWISPEAVGDAIAPNAAHVVKLMRRRMPEWSAIIG